MSKWSDKSTNQLLLDVEQLKMKHETVKQSMLKMLDEMEDIEKDFIEANKIIQERLKGVKDV